MPYRKKLIEVALPLEAINREAAREKSIRHGHPSTLHLWWARRPLAACRAVLFSSLVDDPEEPEAPQEYLDELDKLPGGVGLPPETPIGEVRREKLFRFIEELVKWDNSNNERIIGTARRLILAATEGNPPPVLDPFCGGGSIPLEAQRLGLEAHGSDLNPVAVLITKALVEIPPKFAGQAPVNPEARRRKDTSAWPVATGLADDVRCYGKWMRNETEKRFGYLYPKVKLPREQGGGEATVIAWLWARTVQCPNPACGREMPLLSNLVLSSKAGKECYLRPVFDARVLSFDVGPNRPAHPADPKKGFKRGMSGIFECVFCGTVTTRDYVATEGVAGRLGRIQTAVVAEGPKGRVYLPAESSPTPENVPEVNDTRGLDVEFAPNPRDLWCRNFGLTRPRDAFTPRQLVVLTTFCDLVGEVRGKVREDALAAGMADDPISLDAGGTGAQAYADAVGTYLALVASKATAFHNTLARWRAGEDKSAPAIGRQAIPMVWDFTEVNPFAGAGGDFDGITDGAAKTCASLPAAPRGTAQQLDAAASLLTAPRPLISTDPPYYDNIAYADLSDFFYVWLRRSLGSVYPQLFSTLLVPKAQELIAAPYRFDGSRQKAQNFFEDGLGRAFSHARSAQHSAYPLPVFYAFKQTETEENDHDADASTSASTGWETMLEGLLTAGFSMTGTWPMNTEMKTRQVAMGTNALASSIILVCRPRPDNAPMATRREFTSALRKELPPALAQLTHAGIPPVDLAQATIGPGMAVFSRYSKVLEADGSPMTVRTALQIINQELDAYLTEQEGDLDGDTRFCIAWFEQYGLNEAAFGEADVLARAKNTSVEGIEEAGVLHARAGKVRLRQRCDYPEDWDPQTDRRLTVWECTQHLICELERSGEEGAAALVRRLGGGMSEDARALAYRLYAIADRKGWTDEARAYNGLVVSWPAIVEKAARAPAAEQPGLFE